MTREQMAGRGGAIVTATVALLVATLLASLGAAAGPDVTTAHAANCPRAGAPATELPRRALRSAVTCQVNNLRSNRNRASLNRNIKLERVAQRHAKVMVSKECLKARCPGQPPLHRRIRRSGYLDGAQRWKFALNTGCAVNARVMVRKWRERRYHRKNMLSPRLQHIGVGTVRRAPFPRCGDNMATFAALFAWRTK